MAKKEAEHKPEKTDDEPVKHEHSEIHDEPEQTEEAEHGHSVEEATVAHPSQAKHSWYKHLWHWVRNNKKISIPVAVILVVGLLAAVPFTRYTLAGTMLKQTFSVTVVDSETGKPVSSATVSLNGQTVETNNEGKAELRSKVGKAKLTVTKKYYEDSSGTTLVPLAKPKSAHEVRLKAIGRAVPVSVLNVISNQPVANINIAAEGTEAKTGEDGKTVLVVPADKQEVSVTLTGDGFNTFTATLKVTAEEVEANSFKVTPSGKIYFLSNASGKIDLVKSNLDGTERQTVLAGTGKEDKLNTILLASRDWKYVALLSKRDGGDYSKLFLLETDTDKVTTMDEGEASFNVHGWSGDRFIYTVTREKLKNWEPKRQALKSYYAPNKKIVTLVETSAEGSQSPGYVYEYFSGVFILDKEIAFVINWQSGGNAHSLWQTKQPTFNTIQSDGSQRKIVKSYADQYVDARIAEFLEIYIRFEENNNYENAKVDEYRDGKISLSDQKGEDFYTESYPTFIVSPSGNKTLWSDIRDGRSIFFVGDNKGENGNEIGNSDEFSIYGWFTDNYVLLTKKGSQMFIMPAVGLEGGVEKAPKISDYYKPNYYNNGFGYGYGG